MLMEGAAPAPRRVCLCAAPPEPKRSKRRSWLRSQRSLDQWAAATSDDATTQLSRGRRARSAERFEGVRVGEGAVLPTPLPLPTRATSACSPPPSYEAAVSKSEPPSYDECVRPATAAVAVPAPAISCSCARCKPSAGDSGRGQGGALSSCPCSKCQPRPTAYNHPANVNTAVLISLDTTAAMHSALADGVALCVLM